MGPFGVRSFALVLTVMFLHQWAIDKIVHGTRNREPNQMATNANYRFYSGLKKGKGKVMLDLQIISPMSWEKLLRKDVQNLKYSIEKKILQNF